MMVWLKSIGVTLAFAGGCVGSAGVLLWLISLAPAVIWTVVFVGLVYIIRSTVFAGE